MLNNNSCSFHRQIKTEYRGSSERLSQFYWPCLNYKPMIPYERLQKGLERFFGLKTFRPGQLEIINSILNGFDTLAVMPTGGGKSICYQLPALLLDGLTVVITPLISLMRDQVEQINKKGIVATHIDSSLDFNEIQERLFLAGSNRIKLLYVAPERLESKSFTKMLSSTPVSLLAVDEAHCVSQWGHDFRPHYTRISDLAEKIGKPTILALTATATPDVQDDIVAQLRMRNPRVYISGFARENLSFKVFVEKAKAQTILNYVKARNKSGIIYAATRKSVDEIFELLRSNGMKPLRYHAGLTETERLKSHMAFINSDRIMVATNAFGMGINKSNVRYVIHYDVPGTLESYYQEAGRAGRDGKLSECILFFNKRDLKIQEYFIKTLYPEKDQFAKAYNTIFDSLSITVGGILEEIIAVSPQHIATLAKLDARTVESVLRILAQANLIRFTPSSSATAHVKAKVNPESYKYAMQRTASHDTRVVLESLLRLYGTAIFSETKAVALDDIAHKSDLNTSNVQRTLFTLHRSGIIEYKPALEGITFKMLAAREKIDELHIDFQQLMLLRNRANERLRSMVDYATATSCRTNIILSYFGAEEMENGCGNCDNCNLKNSHLTDRPFDDIEITPHEIYTAILALVKETDGKYGKRTYCRILSGCQDESFAETTSKYSAALKGIPEQTILAAFDFLLSRKYIMSSGIISPTISITEDGESFLRKGYVETKSRKSVFRKALYKALREERRELASELRTPIFTICTDDSLIKMANELPRTSDEIARYLPSSHPKIVESRLLQVCLDFAPDLEITLSESERKIYELFLEGLTAREITSYLSTSVQNVIETIENIIYRKTSNDKSGKVLELSRLIKKTEFNRIKSELLKGRDPFSIHKAFPEAELSEILLVSKVINASTSENLP
jgi:ATP-dependent DNA helicase RecQ